MLRAYMPRMPSTTASAAGVSMHVRPPHLRTPVARVPKAGKPRALNQRTADIPVDPKVEPRL